MSASEVKKYVWSALPQELPGSYEKNQFDAFTTETAYKENGEWTFFAFGNIRTEGLPSEECYEKTPGQWIWQKSMKVTTRELKLVATFNEKTKDFEVIDIEKSDAKIETETAEKPVEQVILLHWVKVEYVGQEYHFEGSIENVGRVPLKDIQVEFSLFDEDNNFAASERVPVEPEIIAVGERAHLRSKVNYREKIRNYYCDFIAASGRQFFRISEDIFILP